MVPVRIEAQHNLLDEVARVVGNRSRVVPCMTSIKYLHPFEYRTRQAGLDRKHGLRHQYAQERYKELTGWDCPLAGGEVLTPGQAKRDRDVRDQIAVELGHERRSVTNAY